MFGHFTTLFMKGLNFCAKNHAFNWEKEIQKNCKVLISSKKTNPSEWNIHRFHTSEKNMKQVLSFDTDFLLIFTKKKTNVMNTLKNKKRETKVLVSFKSFLSFKANKKPLFWARMNCQSYSVEFQNKLGVCLRNQISKFHFDVEIKTENLHFMSFLV